MSAARVLRQLVAAGHTVRALVRKGSEDKLAILEDVEVHSGDVTDAGSLVGALAGCDAVIHLVGIIRAFPGRGVTFKKMHVEATENVLAAAVQQGVRRYLHMSSNGTRERGSTDYHRTKWQAEELVRSSGLDWTILRPSLIFGPGSEFVRMLAELIRRVPVVPVIGDGSYRMQPVAVEQVAATFVKALSMPETDRQDLPAGRRGELQLRRNPRPDRRGPWARSKVAKVHQPLFMIKPMVKMLQGFELFPITEDQLKMLIEGNVCDPQEWAQAFALQPVSYAEGIGGCFQGKT